MADHGIKGFNFKLISAKASVLFQWKATATFPSFPLLLISLMPLASCQLQTQILNPRCYRSTNFTGACIALGNETAERTCLGAKIPFTHTSVALAGDSTNLEGVRKKLQLWAGLQNVPQCWAVVQPFLCSVYLPKCTDKEGVKLPSKQLCERTRKPCQIVHDFNNGWPDFLQCNHPNFVSDCGPENYDFVSFNTTGKCEPPLVRTDNPDSWYAGVEGCGVPCNNPLFSEEQHKEVHTFIAVFGSVCLVCTLFTVLTFIIDWKNANRYPALIIFFINACFFLGSVGWMAQFAGDARAEIVCRKDGTIRRGEPQLGSKESVWCPVIFTLVYYFLVAGISWYVMLAYAWCLTFTALGGTTAKGPDPGSTPRDVLRSKTAYFHIISWCSPLVLTIVCLALSEIDGDSVSGICFVGVFNHGVRALFVLVPVGLVIIVGTFFLLRGVCTLTKIRNEAPAFIPEKTFSKIRATIIRLGIFTAVALGFVLITFAVHVYTFANEDKWKASFREYMLCIANVSVSSPSTNAESVCAIKERPSLIAMETHIFAFFGAGIAMSSWSWTKASLSSWERFIRWVFHKPSNKPVKLKRHRMIAQMFEKRKEINQGRVSISYRSSHDDPLGMKFDFNSGSDDELSSNFAMAMPQLVRRRGGVIFPMSSMGRRHSDSDVTSVISTRRVSSESLMEFRDAQFVIVQRDGLPAFALPDPGRRGGRSKRKKLMKTRKQRKRDKLSRVKPTSGPMFTGSRFGSFGKSSSRKGSDSSVLSQLSAASLRFFKIRRKGRNSPESESVNSNIPAAPLDDDHNVIAAQDSSVQAISAVNPRPRLEFGPAKPSKDFGIFSAKKGSSSVRKIGDIEMGVKGGIGEAASPTGRGTTGMLELVDLEETQLPGAPDESEPESARMLHKKMLQQKQQQLQQQQHDHSKRQAQRERGSQPPSSRNSNSKNKHTSLTSQHSSSTQDSSSEDEVERMMWEQMQRQQKQKQPPASATTTTTTTTKRQQVQHLRTVTVETHHHQHQNEKQKEREGGGSRRKSCAVSPNAIPPLHALMADISCGNWGVLLGKSGSSSGSEVGGFSAYNRNISMGRPPSHLLPQAPPPPPPPANPAYFTGGGVGPYSMAGRRNPYEGGAHPYMNFHGNNPAASMMGGTYPYVGKKGFDAGRTHPYLGREGYSYGGPYPPYMGNGMLGAGSYCHPGDSYMNSVYAHSYNMGGVGSHMGHMSNMVIGGAKSKVQDPYLRGNHAGPYQGVGTGRRSQDRRFARERQKERQMRRPNQAFFNSTFDMEDDDIESISVV
ncbi:smoothened [Plakobranchus ocellatus]|uniref:Protein smoothened n=1 Tax=Plakobranchus ocellatus TaxID=259542 RepID=A0AAV4AZ30_9GAST|nr:smoothened [Plakobranchus ocellatus]